MVENCPEGEIIAQLTPYRSVLAGDHLQWIVQDLIGGRWRNVGYCRWRDTILERFIPVDADLHVVGSLKALPALKGGHLHVDTPPATPDSPIEELTAVEVAHDVLLDGLVLQGDHYLLEYYEDGYPKLPVCLDQREPRLRQAA